MIQAISRFYHTLTWRDGVTKVLLALTLLLYPFNNFPFGPFAKLAFYPLLLLLVLNIDRILQQMRENRYLRYVMIVGGLWAIWMVVSLVLSIGFNAIGFKHIKAISGAIRFFLLWYTFAACCLSFPREEIRRLFYWIFVVLLVVCAAYSSIEYLHFAGVEWATHFLKHAIHYFLHTGITEWTGDNVWPPVLWDSVRYRSIFEEPAYYSVLLGFTTLFFSWHAWTSKQWRGMAGNLLLAVLASLLLCGTKSAAGAISTAVARFAWVGIAICFIWRLDRCLRLKLLVLALLFAVGSYFELTTQRHSSSNIGSLVGTMVYEEAEVAARPKTTRSIHLASELECIAAAPIKGHGIGEYDRVMRAKLKAVPYKTGEILVWINREGSVPWLNWFTGLAVMYGVVGLLLFLAWFVFPLAILWLMDVLSAPVEKLCLTAALGLFLVTQMNSANTEIFVYMMLMTIPLLYIKREDDINSSFI